MAFPFLSKGNGLLTIKSNIKIVVFQINRSGMFSPLSLLFSPAVSSFRFK